MSPEHIGFIGIFAVLVLIAVGIHIPFALILVGFIGSWLITGPNAILGNMGIIPFTVTNSYHFSIIPLFLFMSSLVALTGIGREAYDTARAWIGQIRGGLAMATIGACGLFAATSGSSMACSVAMGKIAYPEMKRAGYKDTLSSGCIAAGGTLGILIPPSISFVIVGIIMEVSIGKLFLAGILPGITSIVFYFATIYILCKINPSLGPAGPRTSLKEKIQSFRLTWPITLLFIVIMGGIYLGVFTATEAGGIGSFGALVIGLCRRKLNRLQFIESLKETMLTTIMILFLLIGAFVFMHFLAVSRIPFIASQSISALPVSRHLILIALLFIYLLLGMFFDVMSIIVLTTPIILPTIIELDFNLIWYGVLLVRIAEVGFVTPPFGLNIFALAGSIDAPLESLHRGVFPFVITDVLHIALLMAVPALSLFLPEMMVG